jgi:hypothetical protein
MKYTQAFDDNDLNGSRERLAKLLMKGKKYD